MKETFYSIILGLLILGCDDPDKDGAITDPEGLSIDLSWDGASDENRDGIGLAIYDPARTVMYRNYDSATILNDWVDGQFVCEVEVFLPLVKTDFKIEVQGINKKMGYTFKNSFTLFDRVGDKKRSFW
jgi:hypothetical protein